MALKVVFSPYTSGINKYLDILVGALRNEGVEVISKRDCLFSIKNFRAAKIIHLNWFEDLIGNNRYSRSFDFLQKVFLLLLFRVFNKKIIWTMHNRESHKGGLKLLRNILRDMIFIFSSDIVIHCQESRRIIESKNMKWARKTFYVPHPNYIDEYGPVIKGIDSDVTGKGNETLNLLFLGAIKPYKNIELLLQLVREHPFDVELVIAGNPSSSEYREEIIRLAGDIGNVKLLLDFVPDEQIPLLIGNCDLMVIPLDLKSSLNSGSVILSFSYARSVICPDIGTVKDIQEKDSMFIYNYQKDEDHFQSLKTKVEEAILLKQKDKDSLKKCGERMYRYVSKHNRKEDVGKLLYEVYY